MPRKADNTIPIPRAVQRAANALARAVHDFEEATMASGGSWGGRSLVVPAQARCHGGAAYYTFYVGRGREIGAKPELQQKVWTARVTKFKR